MTPSELKSEMESRNVERHYFTRETMRFFGDRMSNYGVRKTTIKANFDPEGTYHKDGISREVWELYRKRAVKHGNVSSAYFDCDTFKRVFPHR